MHIATLGIIEEPGHARAWRPLRRFVVIAYIAASFVVGLVLSIVPENNHRSMPVRACCSCFYVFRNAYFSANGLLGGTV